MNVNEDRIDSENVAYVERLLELFGHDPAQVPTEWRDYFRQSGGTGGNGQKRFAPSFRPASLFNPPPLATDGHHLGAAERQDRISQLIRAYRVRGHLAARLDPLGIDRREPPELKLGFHGLRAEDLDGPCSTASLGGPGAHTLREVVEQLRTTYCRF